MLIMSSSRDQILSKLRSARQRPFDDAPPRPKSYLPVTVLEDETPDALLERFTRELNALTCDVFAVGGEAAARAQVLELMARRETTSILAWDFANIQVEGLEAAVREAGIEIIQPDTHDEMRMEVLTASAEPQVGL